MCLEIVFSVKLEGGLLQYKAEHFSEKFSSYRRLLGMKVFVCVAHYSDSFLVWDIRVKACDIDPFNTQVSQYYKTLFQ